MEYDLTARQTMTEAELAERWYYLDEYDKGSTLVFQSMVIDYAPDLDLFWSEVKKLENKAANRMDLAEASQILRKEYAKREAELAAAKVDVECVNAHDRCEGTAICWLCEPTSELS